MPDDSAPFLAIGADELSGAERIRSGDHVACPTCGDPHPITYGTKADGSPSTLLAAYTCTQTNAAYLWASTATRCPA